MGSAAALDAIMHQDRWEFHVVHVCSHDLRRAQHPFVCATSSDSGPDSVGRMLHLAKPVVPFLAASAARMKGMNCSGSGTPEDVFAVFAFCCCELEVALGVSVAGCGLALLLQTISYKVKRAPLALPSMILWDKSLNLCAS